MRRRLGHLSRLPVLFATVNLNIAPGTVGAISELRVAADLMTKGMEVFRNLSAHGATDLVIIANRTCFRISVKSAQRKVSGELVVPKEKYPYEILALVLLNDIVYLDPYANVIDVVEYVLRSGLR